jgi:hypothetical protein
MSRTSGCERERERESERDRNYLHERKNMMYTDNLHIKALSPRTEIGDIQGQKYKHNLHGQLSSPAEIPTDRNTDRHNLHGQVLSPWTEM